MLKLYLEDSPLRSGHAVRGIGMYTRNLKSEIAKSVELVGREEDPDIILYPYFDLFKNTLKIKSGEKVVVMIHDVIPLLYPKHYPPGIRGNISLLKQKNELKKVMAILCDSETSKKDIVRYLNVPESKVFPTHLAPNPLVQPVKQKSKLKEVKEKYSLPERFVLYVGDINYNKNVPSLVKACIALKLPLVIVGKQAAASSFDRNHPENQDLKVVVDEFGANTGVKRLGFVPDEDLGAVFSLATLYCQPSFYEGFGLPVLESMAAGCPVVCSKTQALVEIAEDAPVYFDPKDLSDIKSKLKEVWNSQTLRDNLKEKGSEQVKKFSWKKTATETLEAIKLSL